MKLCFILRNKRMEGKLPCSFVTSGMPPAGTTRSNTRLLRARFAPSPSSSIAKPTASLHADKSGMNATDLLGADCNISLLNDLAGFLIPQEPDILQVLYGLQNQSSCTLGLGHGQNKYDLGTRVLWVEISLHSLDSGFPQHGISAVWRRGHQYLYAERNSHEPKRVRSGIYALKPVCGHSLNSCGCVHCALGHSQNIRHRFGADSCWRPVALIDRFPALALLDGIRSAHGDGNQFRDHCSGSHGHHAVVQPVSWKNHGGDTISVGICGLPRRPADQPNSDGEWRKLAASVGHGGRNFCFVRDCRVSVCERASGRPGPNGGRRAGRGALGEGDDGDCTGDKISVGTSTGLPHSSVLDDSRRCHRLPISVFFLYRPLAVAPERSGRAPSGRCIRHGSVHAGGRVRPLDWWLADGRNGGALRVHARFLLLFFGILPSDASFAGSAVDCLQRRHSLWNGVRMDVRLPEYRHGTLLRAGGISKGERNDAGACGSFLLA